MATTPRPIWKGQISFGLVNVPVTLYSAEQRNDIQLHLIDARDTKRVRYQRVNEETGEEVPWDQIAKAYDYDDKGYVVLSKEEIEQVAPKSLKEIEIEDFVDEKEIDPIYFDKPYYLEPTKAGRKPYALLRETLRTSGKIGIARVVIRTREHLAALMVRGDYMVLELIRFPQELRDPDFLDVPESRSVKMSQREIDMAVQLVESMTTDWEPAKFQDEYRTQLLAYIEDKVKRGELSASKPPEDKEAAEAKEEDEEGTVVDLMDYLKKSVEKAKGLKRSEGGKPESQESKTKSRKRASPRSVTSEKKATKKATAKKSSRQKSA